MKILKNILKHKINPDKKLKIYKILPWILLFTIIGIQVIVGTADPGSSPPPVIT